MTLSDPAFGHVFEARVDDSTSILKVLGAVLIEEKPYAMFEFSEDGIKVTVDKHKVIQGAVSIKKECFNHYKFNHSSPSIKRVVDLRYLLKCLGVLSNAKASGDHSIYSETSRQTVRPSLGSDMKSLMMRLETEDSGLDLTLDDETEADSQIRCYLSTQEQGLNPSLFPDIQSVDSCAMLIIRSDLLMELWSDLDHSSEKIWFCFKTVEPVFMLKTKSEIAEVELSVEKKRLSDFKCDREISLCFRMSLIQMIVRSLILSQKVVICFTNDGRMVVNLSIFEDNALQEPLQWVEYVCTSLSEEDHDEFKMMSHFRRSLNVTS